MDKFKDKELDAIMSRTYIKININYHKLSKELEDEINQLKNLLNEKKKILEIAKQKQLLKIKFARNLNELKKMFYELYKYMLATDDKENQEFILVLIEKRKEKLKEKIKEKKEKEALSSELIEENIDVEQENYLKTIEKKATDNTVNKEIVKKEEEIISTLEQEIKKLEEELKQLENL